MKTVKLFFVLALIVGNLMAYSSNKGNSKMIKNEKNQAWKVDTFGSYVFGSDRITEIVGAIGTSTSVVNLNQEGQVLIEYHINETGNVVVDQLNTNNSLLGEQVKKEVERIFVWTYQSSEKKFYAKYSFIRR